MANGLLVLLNDREVYMWHQKTKLTGALCLLLISLSAGVAQSGGSGGQAPVNPKTAAQQKRAGPDDAWWAAQRNIEAAINQLERYLREAPNGSHAPAARQQLAALRSLTITRSQPEWVLMRALALPDVPLWRVAGVEELTDRTRTKIEIKCGRNDGGDCVFRPFDRFPLALVDNRGELYPMIEAHPVPGDIRFAREGQALLAAGRTLSVTVDFAPLQSTATGGQIQFRDANEAQPAKFSLIQKP
jgi:hypothetical protein